MVAGNTTLTAYAGGRHDDERPLQQAGYKMSAGMPSLRVSVHRSQDLSGADIAKWRDLQASDPLLDNAFLSPEFTIATAHSRSNVRVAVIRQGAEAVAFLPFQRGCFGIGCAVGLGVSDAQAIICAPDFSFEPVELVRACGLGLWEFDHLVSRLGEFAPCVNWTTGSAVMDVREGYDAYLQQGDRARGRRIQGLPQKRRGLERELGGLEFVFDACDPSALDSLMRWKSAQWVRTGNFDRFSSDWIRELVQVLANCKETGCRGTLSTLSAGGRLVAAHFGIRTATRLSLWFTAYDYGLKKYSPGLLLFLAIAEAAPQYGVGILDLGKGGEQYKESLASWEYPAAAGRVKASDVSGLVRRAQAGGERRWDEFVVGHPRLRSVLPRRISQIGRVH